MKLTGLHIQQTSFGEKLELSNQMSPELTRDNRRGVSKNAELVLLQKGFKKDALDFGFLILVMTKSQEIQLLIFYLWIRRYSCSPFEELTCCMLFGTSFIGECEDVVWQKDWAEEYVQPFQQGAKLKLFRSWCSITSSHISLDHLLLLIVDPEKDDENEKQRTWMKETE